MRITPERIRSIARLARLSISEDEESRLALQLTEILDYVDQLREVDTEGTPPFRHAERFSASALADDVSRPPLPLDQVLGVAPEREADSFRVPRVIEES